MFYWPLNFFLKKKEEEKKRELSKILLLGNLIVNMAKSKIIGHHCDGQNFFSKSSFLSS